MSSVILITGCSSGFGGPTAEALARRGHTVVATMRETRGRNARAAGELRALAQNEQLKLHVVELDVTNDGSVSDAVGAALSIGGRLDVVINNAGLFFTGPAEAATPDLARRLFEVNYLGTHRVNRAALPIMRKQGSGLLVHVSSDGARHIMPFMAHYVATKAAMECLAESYRYELAPHGIDSVLIEPGAFPTALFEKSTSPDDPARVPAYPAAAMVAQKFGEWMQQTFASAEGPKLEEVAEAIVKVVETPAGQRPLRTVVDRYFGQPAEAINATAAHVQTQMFTAMGMASMLSVAPAVR